jgi:hypothetical protein
MHKSATKCNETLDKWCKNKHGASKIIDTLETYQWWVKERELKNAVRHPDDPVDTPGLHLARSYSEAQPMPEGKAAA